MTDDEFLRRHDALMARPLFASGTCGVYPGWLGIAERLADAVEALPRGDTVRCSQCGEKFGYWMVYLSYDRFDLPLREVMERLRMDAQEESSRTCLLCGEAGEVVQGDDLWSLALCSKHSDLPRDELHVILRGYGDALRRRAGEEDERKLRILREAVQVGVDDVRAGRFATRSVDDIADEVEREGKLKDAILVGIDDWKSGRLDDRPIDEILDEIDKEDDGD